MKKFTHLILTFFVLYNISISRGELLNNLGVLGYVLEKYSYTV
jgi:hypothetical protein